MKLFIKTHENYVYFILCCHNEKRFIVRYILTDLLYEFLQKIQPCKHFIKKIIAYFVLRLKKQSP